MSDPASLNVSLGIVGMDPNEATAVLHGLPVGSVASFTVTKPTPGCKRYAVAADGLSIQGAKDVTNALLEHALRVLEDPGGANVEQ